MKLQNLFESVLNEDWKSARDKYTKDYDRSVRQKDYVTSYLGSKSSSGTSGGLRMSFNGYDIDSNHGIHNGHLSIYYYQTRLFDADVSINPVKSFKELLISNTEDFEDMVDILVENDIKFSEIKPNFEKAYKDLFKKMDYNLNRNRYTNVALDKRQKRLNAEYDDYKNAALEEDPVAYTGNKLGNTVYGKVPYQRDSEYEPEEWEGKIIGYTKDNFPIMKTDDDEKVMFPDEIRAKDSIKKRKI